MSSPDDVLDFWLGPTDDDGDVDKVHRARWWKTSREFDEEIRERFGDLHERACRGELDDWARTPRGRVALVVVLDQFSRNLFRGDPRSWAQDPRAQALTLDALQSGEDRSLAPYERLFLYMPLMHAEDVALQDRSIESFTRLAEEAPERLRSALAGNVDYAHRHRDIVARFGRFPHRNAVLGRASTEEETAFLREPGSSF